MSQEHDKIIKLVQSSTRTILSNYRERAELLRGCSEDVKLLIGEGHNPEIAKNTAERLFGAQDNISFLAIVTGFSLIFARIDAVLVWTTKCSLISITSTSRRAIISETRLMCRIRNHSLRSPSCIQWSLQTSCTYPAILEIVPVECGGTGIVLGPSIVNVCPLLIIYLCCW